MNRIMWPGIIFIILGASVIVHGVMLYVVNTDSTFAVDNRYRAKTDPWWEAVDTAKTDGTVRWTAALDLSPSESIDGMMRLTLRVTNQAGAAVDDAIAELRVFHRARAGEVLEATFKADGAGAYTARIPMNQAGMWKATALLTRGGEHFAKSFDLLVDS